MVTSAQRNTRKPREAEGGGEVAALGRERKDETAIQCW